MEPNLGSLRFVESAKVAVTSGDRYVVYTRGSSPLFPLPFLSPYSRFFVSLLFLFSNPHMTHASTHATRRDYMCVLLLIESSLGFGLSRGNTHTKGFSSTAPRFAPKDGGGVAPSQYNPKRYGGKQYSVSTKGTGTFASKSLARPSGRHARQPGPGAYYRPLLIEDALHWVDIAQPKQVKQPLQHPPF